MTKETKYKKLLHLLVVLCLYGVVQGCSHSPIYKIQGFEATVIDADTKEPIEGVVVASVWQYQNDFAGGVTRYIKVDEAVTDNEGKFKIKGSFPFPRLPFTYLGRHSYSLYVYKFGYKPIELGNGNKEELEKDFGPLDSYSAKVASNIAGMNSVVNSKYDQKGIFRKPMWDGMKIDIEKISMVNMTEEDYRKMASVRFVARDIDKLKDPGGRRLYRLYRMAKEIEKTYFFLNENYKSNRSKYRLWRLEKVIKKGDKKNEN